MTAVEPPEVPESSEALAAAIERLIADVEDPQVAIGVETDGYGKCVEAMWRAAFMAHELVAKRLGVTGFQHSVSSLQVVGALRSIEGPYRLVDVSQALYPQNDVVAETAAFLRDDDVRRWLADRAAELIARFESGPEYLEWTDDDGKPQRGRRVHPRVEAHWRRLMADRPADAAEVAR